MWYNGYVLIFTHSSPLPLSFSGRANFTRKNEMGVQMLRKLSYEELKKRIKKLENEVQERKQVEQALRESKNKYRSILENIKDSYFEVDIAGNLTFFNSSVEKRLGYSTDELKGMNYRCLMSHETAKKVYERFNQVYTSSKSIEGFDFEVIRKDGTTIHADTIISLIRDADGQPMGFRCLSRDFTERKRAEAALKRSKDELEKRVTERTLDLAKINEELEVKSNKLEEVNTALRILLKKREDDKIELEKKMLFNVQELVLPYLEKLNTSGLKEWQKAYVDIIGSNLNDIVSPFLHDLSTKFLKLTHTEIHIANFIKHGKTTKEIAQLLNLSEKTVQTHRKNIRKKIGLKNTKANLRTHLLSIQ